MNNDIIDTLIIDPNLSHYEKFFDHIWAKGIFEAVNGSSLEYAINSLVVSWRSTNGAHILPWLMAESLKRYSQGEIVGSQQYRMSYIDTVINGVVEKIERMMQYSLNLDQRFALRRAVERIEIDAHLAIKIAREKVRFDVDGYWKFLVNSSEFQFSILGIQRINYGTLFFAYEDFLANVIRTKEPNYSSKVKSINVAFPTHFGKSLGDFCWNHDEVVLAKLVRNSLAHNGGRFGKDLEKFKTRFANVTGTDSVQLQGNQFNLIDEKIQITPDNTTYLFTVLKERVTKIVAECK